MLEWLKNLRQPRQEEWVSPRGINLAEDNYGGFTLLEEGIYLGGRPNYIPSHIKAVLCLTESRDTCPGIENVELVHMGMIDGEYCGDAVLEEAIGIIQEWKSQKIPSLIHCYSGRSRTGLVAISYVMNEYNLTLASAALKVHQTRSIIDPATEYKIALQDYETLLKSRGLILSDKF